MKTNVVPLPSVRETGVIPMLGSCTPSFSAAIFGSFHFVIFPWKMSASVAPSSFTSPWKFGRLYAATTAPATVGICTTSPAAAASSFLLMGASEPAKSTVFSVMPLIPPPEPIDW